MFNNIFPTFRVSVNHKLVYSRIIQSFILTYNPTFWYSITHCHQVSSGFILKIYFFDHSTSIILLIKMSFNNHNVIQSFLLHSAVTHSASADDSIVLPFNHSASANDSLVLPFNHSAPKLTSSPSVLYTDKPQRDNIKLSIHPFNNSSIIAFTH